MANSINWGRIYCFTEFGDEDNTIAESIPDFSAPECFLLPITGDQIETKAFTIDTIDQSCDNIDLTVDQTLIEL
tara:strand:- start:47 stop:268 length:222 start_codon:yes stop_codon:yes gene_type:complete